MRGAAQLQGPGDLHLPQHAGHARPRSLARGREPRARCAAPEHRWDLRQTGTRRDRSTNTTCTEPRRLQHAVCAATEVGDPGWHDQRFRSAEGRDPTCQAPSADSSAARAERVRAAWVARAPDPRRGERTSRRRRGSRAPTARLQGPRRRSIVQRRALPACGGQGWTVSRLVENPGAIRSLVRGKEAGMAATLTWEDVPRARRVPGSARVRDQPLRRPRSASAPTRRRRRVTCERAPRRRRAQGRGANQATHVQGHGRRRLRADRALLRPGVRPGRRPRARDLLRRPRRHVGPLSTARAGA